MYLPYPVQLDFHELASIILVDFISLSSQIALKGLQKNIVSFVEIRPSTAVEILDFLSKIEDKKEAEKVLKNMILDGFLDEVFKDDEAPEPEVDPDKLGEIEAFHDPSGPEADDDLEDY